MSRLIVPGGAGWQRGLRGRRSFLRNGSVAGAAFVLGLDGLFGREEGDIELAPTESDVEGPFHVPGAPERADLTEPGLEGNPMDVSGRVYNLHGEPVPGALIDVWQANAAGVYDNDGYRLRGKLHADESGFYRLKTIRPAPYGRNRTAHIHAKVSAPVGPILTTQIYFRGEPRNTTDSFVRPSRIVSVHESNQGQRCRFDFVIVTA